MDVARTILAALIALSVGLLPVAGARARAPAPGDTQVITQSDCCPDGQDCAKPGKNECGKSVSCALKCSAVFAAMLGSSAVTMKPSASVGTLFVSEDPASRSSDPPLPPPRV